MVIRSDRSREQPSRSVFNLEKLLRTGDAVLYGQVCWSLANRATERPTAGDVITLEGGDEAGDHSTRFFRLSRETIENVERCLGMRTCEEAVASFAGQEGRSQQLLAAHDSHGHPMPAHNEARWASDRWGPSTSAILCVGEPPSLRVPSLVIEGRERRPTPPRCRQSCRLVLLDATAPLSRRVRCCDRRCCSGRCSRILPVAHRQAHVKIRFPHRPIGPDRSGVALPSTGRAADRVSSRRCRRIARTR